MRRLLKLALSLVLVAAAAVAFLVLLPLRNPHPPLRLPQQTAFLADATIYLSPDLPPLHHSSILIRNGRIAEVGPNLTPPPGTTLLPCNQCTVTAGFWNAHVHFTQPVWSLAAYKPAATLNASLQDMLTSRGFTTVVDTGSNPIDTISLRRRIETGALLGPFIYTAGAAQYPPHALPFYLRRTQPWFIQRLSPQPETPAAAAAAAEKNIARGADVLKLFTGSYLEPDTIVSMPVANARAAIQVAHAHGQLAFAHPSSLAGILVARDSGVDILAHAADTTDGVTPEILTTLVSRQMAMTPTLKMFGTTVTTKPAYLNPIFEEVRQFHTLGGTIIFGTDVGYMTDYSTTDEFTYLQRSGLSQMDILRMLTLAPATRFGVAADCGDQCKGTIHPGALADLTILASDPATDPAAFSNVAATVRTGRLIYTRPLTTASHFIK